MIYAYKCDACALMFDVIKTVAHMTDPETCKCGANATRQFMPQKIHLFGTSVQNAEYNPGLGCIVKNSKHRAEIAKQKGLEEVGNSNPDKIAKQFAKEREEKREKAYEDADRGWVGAEP